MLDIIHSTEKGGDTRRAAVLYVTKDKTRAPVTKAEVFKKVLTQERVLDSLIKALRNDGPFHLFL